MSDPIILRIIGTLLLAAGAVAIGLDMTGYAESPVISGAVAAGIGALCIVVSSFFRRSQEGLHTTGERRTGKPSGIVRMAMFWGGLFLVIISPLVGAIPGPGGIFVFAAGFGLMLRGSRRVKRMYVRFKRRHPAKGDWADFGMGRGSYKRRQARARAEAGDCVPADLLAHWTEPGELERRRQSAGSLT